MKKRIACLFALLLAVLLALPANADTVASPNDWQVAFTAQNQMSSNFTSAQLSDLVKEMQPGDTAIINLNVTNLNPTTTDWYMTNEVLSSLEASRTTAAGGAYTYRLVYHDHNGVENILFDSETVGGEEGNGDRKGLNEATQNLEDYFYLDTLANGQHGALSLTVGLDGETQGNGYQDTLAKLQMNFAVELRSDTPRETVITREGSGGDRTRSNARGSRTTVVYTGDKDMTPYLIAAAISGLILLLYAVYSLNVQRRKKKRGRAK